LYRTERRKHLLPVPPVARAERVPSVLEARSGDLWIRNKTPRPRSAVPGLAGAVGGGENCEGGGSCSGEAGGPGGPEGKIP